MVRKRERLEYITLLTSKMEEDAVSQERRQPLEAGRGKEMGFPLEPPEGVRLCSHFNVSSTRFLLVF